MIFKGNDLRMITPLDPVEGTQYTEPVQDEQMELNNIYHMTTWNVDYINPTANGNLSFWSASPIDLDIEAIVED